MSTDLHHISNEQTFKNPFPGLRSYTPEEAAFFAGREIEKHQLMNRLSTDNFSAVVGDPGVGKTSFVNCQILPELSKGYVVNGVKHWRIVGFRPGQRPLESLSLAFFKLVLDLEREERISPDLNLDFEGTLHKKYGVIEILEQIFELTGGNQTNTLIYIDHLDDVISYQTKQAVRQLEVNTFIERIEEVINQSAYPINIITSIRIESIRHFSRYPGLMETINRNQFLIGELAKKELLSVLAITEANTPVKFSKGFIKSVNDYYKVSKTEPGVFQHALKQCVDQWYTKFDQKPIGETYLYQIGGIQSSLPTALEIVYEGLDEEMKRACMLVFQSITQKTKSGEILLIPQAVGKIADITDLDYSVVSDILERFQEESCGAIKIFNPQNIEGRLGALDHLLDPLGSEIGKIIDQLNLVLRDPENSIWEVSQLESLETIKVLFKQLEGLVEYLEDSTDSETSKDYEISHILNELDKLLLELDKNPEASNQRLIRDILRIVHRLDPSEKKVWSFTEVTVAQDIVVEKWPRLRNWIWEEEHNATVYKDLANDVAKNEPLYEGKKFETTREWYEANRPHPGWAARYGVNYQQVDAFYQASKQKYEDAERDKETDEQSRKQKTLRNRANYIILAVLIAALIGVGTKVGIEATKATIKLDSATTQLEVIDSTAASLARRSDSLTVSFDSVNYVLGNAKLEIATALQNAKKAQEDALLAQKEVTQTQLQLADRKQQINQLAGTLRLKSDSIKLSQNAQQHLALLEQIRRRASVIIRNIENSDDDIKVKRHAVDVSYQQFLLFRDSLEVSDRYKNATDTIKLIQQQVKNYLLSAMNLAAHQFELDQRLTTIKYPGILERIENNNGATQMLVASSVIESNSGKGLARLSTTQDSILNMESIGLPVNQGQGISSLAYQKSSGNILLGLHPLESGKRKIALINSSGQSFVYPSDNFVEAIYSLDTGYVLVDQRANVWKAMVNGQQVDLSKISEGQGSEKYNASDLFVNGNTKILYVVTSDRIKQITLGRQVTEIEISLPNRENITAIKFVSDKDWLVVGNRKGELYIYQHAAPHEQVYYARYEHSTKGINCLALDNSQRIIVSGGRDRVVNVWDLETIGSSENTSYEPVKFNEIASVRDIVFVDENKILVASAGEGLEPSPGSLSMIWLDFYELGEALRRIKTNY